MIKFKNLFLLSIFIYISSSITLAADATRAKQHFGLSLIPIGYGPNQWFAQGGTLNFYLGDSTILDFEYINTSGKLSNTKYPTNTTERNYFNSVSYGVHLRRFLSDSFYIKIGADQRNIDYTMDSNGSGSFSPLIAFKAKSLMATFSIGNEWQLNHFILGCEWLGAAVPLNYEFTDTYASASATAENQKFVEDDKDFFVFRTVPMY